MCVDTNKYEMLYVPEGQVEPLFYTFKVVVQAGSLLCLKPNTVCVALSLLSNDVTGEHWNKINVPVLMVDTHRACRPPYNGLGWGL